MITYREPEIDYERLLLSTYIWDESYAYGNATDYLSSGRLADYVNADTHYFFVRQGFARWGNPDGRGGVVMHITEEGHEFHTGRYSSVSKVDLELKRAMDLRVAQEGFKNIKKAQLEAIQARKESRVSISDGHTSPFAVALIPEKSTAAASASSSRPRSDQVGRAAQSLPVPAGDLTPRAPAHVPSPGPDGSHLHAGHTPWMVQQPIPAAYPPGGACPTDGALRAVPAPTTIRPPRLVAPPHLPNPYARSASHVPEAARAPQPPVSYGVPYGHAYGTRYVPAPNQGYGPRPAQ